MMRKALSAHAREAASTHNARANKAPSTRASETTSTHNAHANGAVSACDAHANKALSACITRKNGTASACNAHTRPWALARLKPHDTRASGAPSVCASEAPNTHNARINGAMMPATLAWVRPQGPMTLTRVGPWARDLYMKGLCIHIRTHQSATHAVQLQTGHGLVVGHGPQVGDPWSKHISFFIDHISTLPTSSKCFSIICIA